MEDKKKDPEAMLQKEYCACDLPYSFVPPAMLVLPAA
jgi:hypothetical protein